MTFSSLGLPPSSRGSRHDTYHCYASFLHAIHHLTVDLYVRFAQKAHVVAVSVDTHV